MPLAHPKVYYIIVDLIPVSRKIGAIQGKNKTYLL